ncbi:uncharacterized protein LOC143887511 isoform X2 [Tasmannia lanceolata]|uniref:uncharacterized protein LOC143887511 isoform X2 n=1 Tax=Tasmannia lanceolata TaxID=3420 RepID=UPI004062A05F
MSLPLTEDDGNGDDDGMNMVRQGCALVAVGSGLAVAAMMEEEQAFFECSPYKNTYLTPRTFLPYVVRSDERCHDLLRMNVDCFTRFVHILKGTGWLNDTIHCSVEEQLAIFFHIISDDQRNHCMKAYFRRSGETVSRYFSKVLDAIMSMTNLLIKPPSPDTPPQIRANERWYPYFKLKSFQVMDDEADTAKAMNAKWSTDMDRVLVAALRHQFAEGQTCLNGFKETAYVYCTTVVNETFGLQLKRTQIENRVKGMNKIYKILHGLVNRSGFDWDCELKRLTVTNDVGENFVRDNLDIAKFFKKRYDLYDDWVEIFGKDIADGGFRRSYRDPPRPVVEEFYTPQMPSTEDDYFREFLSHDDYMGQDSPNFSAPQMPTPMTHTSSTMPNIGRSIPRQSPSPMETSMGSEGNRSGSPTRRKRRGSSDLKSTLNTFAASVSEIAVDIKENTAYVKENN